MKEKSNKQFMIMSAIAIVMVVDSHSWTILSLGTSLFPYNSFFMGLFIFVSGYFIDYRKNTLLIIKKKIISLMVPYLFYSIIYTFLINLLRIFFNINIGIPFQLKKYIKGIFFNGEILDINSPAYFVLILFYIEIIYIILRKILNKI